MSELERRSLLRGLASTLVPLPVEARAALVEQEASDGHAVSAATLPPISANSMLVDNIDGTLRESRTFADIRDLLGLSGRYHPSAAYISQIERFRQFGISPEDVDQGNEIGNGADAAIPLREMFGQGHDDGITVFNLAAGREYKLSSWDPSDEHKATAIMLHDVKKDIVLNANGATLKGLPGIQKNTANPGAILRIEASEEEPNASSGLRFAMYGGKVDTSSLPSSSAGLTTVGGVALVGRLNIELRSVFFDSGNMPPNGLLVGRGGGDQAVFASAFESYLSQACFFRGWPDLAEYLSNSQGRGSRHIGNFYKWCQRGIGLKRFSSQSIIALNRWLENDVCIYNPVSDGISDNHGGAFQILGNFFERTQSRPIDISGASATGSVVCNNRSLGHGRQISDNAENIIDERLAWLRTRAPRTIIANNYVGMGNMEMTRTIGKEQVGVIFGYSGGRIDTGATDCLSSGNIFDGLYQAHRLEANTAHNKISDCVRVNVAAIDSDAGDNAFPIRLNNEALQILRAPFNRAVLQLECKNNTESSPNGAFHCDMSGNPKTTIWPSWIALPGNINLTSRTSSVEASPKGKFTISSRDDGSVALINRTGATVLLNPTWLRNN